MSNITCEMDCGCNTRYVKKTIGRVWPFPRGEWDKLTDYDVMDGVMYEGSFYVAVVKNKGYRPDMYKDTWTKITERGEKGEQGERGEKGESIPVFKGTWDKEQVYNSKDCVYFQGSTWVCLQDGVIGVQPNLYPDREGKWQLLCKGFEYKILTTGEIIFYYNDKLYPAKTFVENVYIKDDEGEISLKKKLDALELILGRCVEMLVKYDLWDYQDDLDWGNAHEDESDDTEGSEAGDGETSKDTNEGIITDSEILEKLNQIINVLQKNGLWDGSWTGGDGSMSGGCCCKK